MELATTHAEVAVDRRLRRTALLVPWLLAALVAALLATHPGERGCDDPRLTSADHTYLTELRGAGGASALVALVVIALLLRRRRRLRPSSSGWSTAAFGAAMVLAAAVIVVGVTVELPLLAPFLVIGYLSTVFLVTPIAAGCAYVGAARSAAGDPPAEQRFITRALIFYWLSLALLIPGVFALLAVRVSPICLD